MKSDLLRSQQKNAKEFPERIVFQLDDLLDTLHYCVWTSSVSAEGATGTIHEFRKALRQCKIVHPDDLIACDQVMQTQADISKVSASNIRLFDGSANYIWYRLYTVTPENPQSQQRTISGVLEALQHVRGNVRRKGERLKQDTLFRKAVTSSSILSLGFHYTTGERLASDTDVLPQWLPVNARLKDILYILREQAFYTENKYRIEDLLTAEAPLTDGYAQKAFFRDCKLSDLSKKTEDFRWYRIYHAFIRETLTSPICFYLTIMDIHEEKSREKLAEEDITFDRTTGMLKRCAFENQASIWLERVRGDAVYSNICSVVIVIDHAVDMVAKQGRDHMLERVFLLSKTIKVFIHPHEMCGRYGFAQFAMVLSSASTEILQERLKMLRMICNSLNSEWPDLRVRFGSNLELASQMEQGDEFLEKAHLSLQGEDMGSLKGITQFTMNGQVPAACYGNVASIVCNDREASETNGKRRIFIRTFGHFDVFVDGQAILFNHSKAKELLALLVDRRGGFVGATEAISCLWEDEPANNTTLSRCRKAALHLRETLLKHGIEQLMETVNGKRRITVGNCDCDYYQYLQHVTDNSHHIPASYLNEYSWVENTVAHEQ